MCYVSVWHKSQVVLRLATVWQLSSFSSLCQRQPPSFLPPSLQLHRAFAMLPGNNKVAVPPILTATPPPPHTCTTQYVHHPASPTPHLRHLIPAPPCLSPPPPPPPALPPFNMPPHSLATCTSQLYLMHISLYLLKDCQLLPCYWRLLPLST